MENRTVIITALEQELNINQCPRGYQVVYSGVGKINAALATLKAIQTYKPEQIINFGTVGKINSDLTGLIEVLKVVQHDMMTEPLAPRGKTPFCEKPSVYLSNFGQYTCGTGDRFVTSYDQWFIESKIDVVDMELYAIASVAHAYQIPWRSYKYITDDANENSGSDWSNKVHTGQELFLEKLRNLNPHE